MNVASTESPIVAMKPGLAWLIASVAIVLVVSAGVAFPPGDWYGALRKPTWQPPNAVFGPVWTTLYLLMMVSLALLLQAPAGARRSRALRWFAAQLVLNAVWTPLFFGLQQPLVAFFSICLLWLCLLRCTFASFEVRGVSGWLLVPTLLWVSFALVLNGVIVALN